MSFFKIIAQRCPKCGDGKMFKGAFSMNETCPGCHFKFDRGEGYYTMAILIANFLYALIVAPTLLVMTTNGEPIISIVLTLSGISIIVIPLIFRYARTIWLHIDFFVHPE